MLQKLLQAAQEGTLVISEVYLGHITRNDDRKVLTRAEVMQWDQLEPSIRSVLERHLYQAIGGGLGEVNFPAFYTGEVLSVAKVASPEFDRMKNRPAVEIMESIRDLPAFNPDELIELGNAFSYKVMAAGAITNHLVAVLRFQMVPSLGARPVQFVFTTLCDLEDREDALFDEDTGKFITHALSNVIKRASVSRAVFFPCLDDDGRESADLMIYATSGAAWFKALEAGLKLSPRREGQALVRMIAAENAGGEVPHDLFRKMGEFLYENETATGLEVNKVADSLEKAVGHGIDRLGFKASWESAFGDLGYKPVFDSLFGGPQENPISLRMQAGDIDIKLAPTDLERFRQMTVGDQTFIVFAVEQRAKVVIGKDLDLKIKPVAPDALRNWMDGKPAAS
ncbi:MAG TPA: hypothetical protein VGK74_22340 [Symbiobacteriaceae bacterium]|jgi:hypothetical protein